MLFRFAAPAVRARVTYRGDLDRLMVPQTVRIIHPVSVTHMRDPLTRLIAENGLAVCDSTEGQKLLVVVRHRRPNRSAYLSPEQ